jgi:two-component system, OmpR family, response regulator
MAADLPSIRILVVDDDQAICEFVTTILEHDGYEVTALQDPLLVEDQVKKGDYHLVILDVMMPKITGIQVLEQIRKIDSDLAVVMFTGYPDLETAVASMKLDATDYLKKPFQPEELRDVVARVMRKKGLSRSPEENLQRVIGDTIRQLRKEKSLTLKQMSKRTGLSVSLLSQIERAESWASIPSLYTIAVALDSKMRDLFAEF